MMNRRLCKQIPVINMRETVEKDENRLHFT